MSFMSLTFYGWLALSVVVFRLSPGRWRPALLLAMSVAFCAAASLVALAILAAATTATYLVGLRLAAARSDASRTSALLVGVIPLVAALAGFKVAGVLGGVLIPLGLSYYTFKLLSYLVETYWDAGCVERRFVDFAAYTAFGAQMVSGPIQRPSTFFMQLDGVRTGKLDESTFESGLRLILVGLFLKLVIGDRLGSFTTLASHAPESYSRPVLATAAIAYLPQLYADFAGYTNIALGIGLLFGIEGPPNFDAPFSATNLQDYWRRWHMSLTTWLTDYVFTPLRMATRYLGTAGLVISVMVNMTLIGIWHGFTVTYLAFGVLHGVFLTVSVLTLKRRTRFLGRFPWLKPFRMVFGILVVQVLLAVGQIFFQAPSLTSALTYFRLLATSERSGGLGFSDIRADVADPVFICLGVAFYLGAGAPGSVAVRNVVTRWVPNWLRYGLCLLAIAALTLEKGGVFIYGQF